MARADSVCTLFYGSGRAGKTFQQVQEMVDQWLPDETGPIWTNLPLNIEKVAEYVSKRTGKPAAEYAARIHLIPDDVFQGWRLSALSSSDTVVEQWDGPWKFFLENPPVEVDDYGHEIAVETRSIKGGRIILDEAHHVWPSGASLKYQNKWQVWGGELGHAHCRLTLLSQDLTKLSELAVAEAGMRYVVVNSETERDPFLKILLKDWYELIASVTGVWMASCWVAEERKLFGKTGKTDYEKYRFKKAIFDLYNSHAAPIAGGQSAAAEYRREYEHRSFFGVLAWFARRNAPRFILPGVKLGFVLYLIYGGAGQLFSGISAMTANAMKPKAKADGDDVKKKTAAAAAGVQYHNPVTGQTVTDLSPGKIGPQMVADLDFQERWIEQKRMASQSALERAALEAEIKRLRSEVAGGSEVAGLQPGRCVMRDGTVLTVGQEIPAGPFAGLLIKDILYDRREVVLRDGHVLRVGWVNKRLSSPANEGEFSPDQTSVPKHLPRSFGLESGQEYHPASGGKDRPVSGWYDPKRVGPVSGNPLQNVDSAGAGTGRKASHPGVQGGNRGNGSVDGGTTGGSIGNAPQ